MRSSEEIQKIKEKVLRRINSNNIDKQFDNWYKFLEDEFNFPFKAKIQDSECDDLKLNDTVNVKKIENFVDTYGLLLEIRKGRKKYIFPLCDLEIIEKQSGNRFIAEAFLEWWVDNYC